MTPHLHTKKRIKSSESFSKSQLGKEPIVFTNIMKEWVSYPKWTLGYLKEKFPRKKILADRIENGQAKFIHVELKDFIDYVKVSKEAKPYYGKSALHLDTDLRIEYDSESYFDCWYRSWYSRRPSENRLNLSNLYIGPKNAKSLPHNDLWGTSFWNALYEGKKMWLFYEKKDERYLYGGEVDPFDPNCNSKWPDYSNAEPVIHIQQPGELIYSPGNIWHAVLTMEPSLSLSENFINAENYQNVLDTFQDHNYETAFNKMKIIANHFLHK